MSSIKCHFDDSVCDPDMLFVDFEDSESKDKKLKMCKDCPYREEIYKQYLDESIKSAEANPKSNIHLIRKTVKDKCWHFVAHGGHIKDRQFKDDDIGVLVAATSTLEDYYYVIVNKDLTISYSSCVGRLILLDEMTEIPDSFSKLSKLLHNDKAELKRIVEEKVNSSKFDKLITEINIQ